MEDRTREYLRGRFGDYYRSMKGLMQRQTTLKMPLRPIVIRGRKSLRWQELNLGSSLSGNDKGFARSFQVFPFLANSLGFFPIDKAVFVKSFGDGMQ